MATRITTVSRRQAALLVVDLQYDFMPGGTLAVPDADQILAPTGALMESGLFELIVAVQDWHPRDHVSFASNHRGRKPLEKIELYGHGQTLWPDHCIQGSAGAALYRGLPWEKAAAIIRKAIDPSADSYSAIRDNWHPDGERRPTGLAGYLRNRGVQDLFICGLARDFCVKWTAEDAVAEGFRVWVPWDLCRSIDASGDAALKEHLRMQRATIIEARDLYEAEQFSELRHTSGHA